MQNRRQRRIALDPERAALVHSAVRAHHAPAVHEHVAAPHRPLCLRARQIARECDERTVEVLARERFGDDEGLLIRGVFDTAARIARRSAAHRALSHGFERVWRPVRGIGPQRHRGYAFQWFSLALALLVIYVVVNTRRHPA